MKEKSSNDNLFREWDQMISREFSVFFTKKRSIVQFTISRKLPRSRKS